MMRATVLWATLLLLTLVPLGVSATCRFTSGGSTSVTFSLPQAISIPANTPIGTVLASTGQISPANPPVIGCGYYFFGYWVQSSETLTYGVANARGGYLADNTIYASGISGVGFRLSHPGSYLTPYPLNTQSISSSTFSVTTSLDLVKTGPIISGSVLAGGSLGSWKWVDSSGNILIPESFYLGNSITFTTPSCTIITNPINVILPTVTTNTFTGVGSVSGKKSFSIDLSCPTGTAVNKITMHTTTPDIHQGVVAPAGAGYAAGIGVQVLDANSSPVVFETQSVVTPPNATASIPYFAQYFQTAPTVSSGNVKATVTFDIFYQ